MKTTTHKVLLTILILFVTFAIAMVLAANHIVGVGLIVGFVVYQLVRAVWKQGDQNETRL